MFKPSLLLALLVSTPALAVKTQFFTHATKADFEAGTLDKLVMTNFGDLRLSQAVAEVLTDTGDFASIDAIAELPDGTVLLGTTASGKLIALRDQKPQELANYGEAAAVSALTVNPAGDAIIGVSGEAASVQILRKGAQKPEPLATLDDAQYVWGIAIAADGTIYCATGPDGKLFEVTADGKTVRVVYDSDEDNLRAIAVLNDSLYVGTDPSGLILKIDRSTGKAFVIFDAPENEVSTLLIDPNGGQIYAATSQLVESALPDEAEETSEGRPQAAQLPGQLHAEPGDAPQPSDDPAGGGTLQGEVTLPEPAMPATNEADPATTKQSHEVSASGPRSTLASATDEMGEPTPNGNAIYRVDPQGFVSEIFRESVMIFGLARRDGQLLVATGPAGTLYQLDLSSEEHVAVVKSRAEHLTSIATARDGRVFFGTGGTGGAGLSSLTASIADSGSYTSAVLDAGQSSTFGKLQVRGSVPEGTSMTLSTRAGNVSDENSPLWSEWSTPVPAARFTQTQTPAARYVQYRVALAGNGSATPVLEEVRLAYQQPNVSPRIDSVTVNAAAGDETVTDSDTPGNPQRSVEWSSTEPNGDDLSFTLSYRLNGGPWVLLSKELTESTYSWDTRRVPDGRYEIKVEASDALANPSGQGKAASRVSDPITIDNTPPVLGDVKIDRAGGKVTVTVRAADRSGIISGMDYLLDGSEHWQTVQPSDMLDDSPDEQYVIVLADPGTATRVISLRCRDDSGNIAREAITVRPEK